MAQSEAEKKAKRHEYYMEYTKKNKKKGRKKGKTKAKKTSLVGLQTGGLNEQGAMQWALAKEKLTSEMNAALGKAKTPEERDKIRQEYQQKALAELQKMKKDPSMAKAKTTKSSKGSTGSKSSAGGSKSSSGSSKSSGSSSKSSSSSTKSSSTSANTSTANTASAQQMTKAVEQMKDVVAQLQDKLLGDDVKDKIASMSEEQKQAVRSTIESAIADLRKKMTAATSIKVR